MGDIKNLKAVTSELYANTLKKSERINNHQESSRTEPCGTIQTVEELFAQFTVWYGDAWTYKTQNEEWEDVLKQQWLGVLQQMTIAEIKAAVRFLFSTDNDEYATHPPKLLEFLQLPKKIKAKSIPPVDECYNAALRRDWQLHPIVYPAAMACDFYWLKTQASFYEGRKRFTGHYMSQKEKYLRGEVLLQPERNQKQLAKLENEIKQMKSEPQLELSKKMARFKNLSVYPKFMASKGLWSKLRIYCGAISDKGIPNWVEGKNIDNPLTN